MDSDKDLPKPAPKPTTESKPPVQQRGPRVGRLATIVFLCFVASLLGSYAFVKSGLVTPDAGQTITQNRDKLVLQEGEVIAEVAKNVSPSAVSITTEQVSSTRSIYGGAVIQQGAGSGIVLSKDGYVLTNKHVVPDGTRNVKVVMSDGTEYTDVKIVGRDPVNDIAFLKINGVSNLTPAPIGDSSSMVVGQKVVAIGNALGEFQNTVTAGIISGIGRPLQAASEGSGGSESLENLFQTDAAINPGNSGGPLLNFKGEVIGINTAVAQDAQGIGFAIPINDAAGLIKSVLATGKVERGIIGVRYVALTPQIATQNKLPVREGAWLVGSAGAPAVVPGGPADRAGLKANDIIVKVNDQKITEGRSLAGLLGQFRPGDEVTLTVLRDGHEQTLKVKLEASS
jgi:serine protease Do